MRHLLSIDIGSTKKPHAFALWSINDRSDNLLKLWFANNLSRELELTHAYFKLDYIVCERMMAPYNVRVTNELAKLTGIVEQFSVNNSIDYEEVGGQTWKKAIFRLRHFPKDTPQFQNQIITTASVYRIAKETINRHNTKLEKYDLACAVLIGIWRLNRIKSNSLEE